MRIHWSYFCRYTQLKLPESLTIGRLLTIPLVKFPGGEAVNWTTYALRYCYQASGRTLHSPEFLALSYLQERELMIWSCLRKTDLWSCYKPKNNYVWKMRKTKEDKVTFIPVCCRDLGKPAFRVELLKYAHCRLSDGNDRNCLRFLMNGDVLPPPSKSLRLFKHLCLIITPGIVVLQHGSPTTRRTSSQLMRRGKKQKAACDQRLGRRCVRTSRS